MSSQPRLRQLPLPSRLVVACFLAAVGFGYAAALAQLHFQHAAPGKLLPGTAELERIYSPAADKPVSPIERVLEATDGPFNAGGTMRPAFFERSTDWETLVGKLSDDERRRVMQSREGERLALLDWVRTGANRETYDQDDHPLPPSLDRQPITFEMLVKDPATDRPISPPRLRIRTLLEKRCVVCHSSEAPEEERARLTPLNSYERLRHYSKVTTKPVMSLPRLAQTTHAHLLSFAMLFGLTGLLFSFTGYPIWVRCVLAPWPLVIQCVEISFWWLARVEPFFARAIWVTGLLVGVGLGVHILGCLWELVDRRGREST